jgi:serine/threonine protein kinase
VGFTDTPPYCIATEYVPNGSLSDALSQSLLTPSQKSVIALAIAHGMNFLHRQNVMHRDLKPMNILLDSRWLPKICDFGISRFVAAEGASKVTAQIGTAAWMAPEMFESTTYDKQVDVYSFGMLLWAMLTEKEPFAGRDGMQIAVAVCKNGARPQFPPGTPRALIELIKACWAQDSRERPTLENVVASLASGRAAFAGTDMGHLRNAVQFVGALEPIRATASGPLLRSRSHARIETPEMASGPLVRSRSNGGGLGRLAEWDARVIGDLWATAEETRDEVHWAGHAT